MTAEVAHGREAEITGWSYYVVLELEIRGSGFAEWTVAAPT